MSSTQLALEVAVVGAVLAAALACVAWLVPGALRSVWKAALTGLVLGAGVHLGFELSGLNRMYCDVGHACASGNIFADTR